MLGVFVFWYNKLMQKYIAVVSPKTDKDEISRMIESGVSAAIFSISHQNYGLAARLISDIQSLSKKFNRPVSMIQDTSEVTDPMDLELGVKSGIDWLATSNPTHIKFAKKFNKTMPIIFKGRNLPKGVRVDSIMDRSFVDPDAVIKGPGSWQIKHLTTDHPKQSLLDSLLHMANSADTSTIAVSDLDLAKTLSWRRPVQKIVFAPKDRKQASRAALYWGVHPVFGHYNHLIKKGERVLDATNAKHIAIHLVS